LLLMLHGFFLFATNDGSLLVDVGPATVEEDTEETQRRTSKGSFVAC